MQDPLYLTQEGYERLKKELEHLVNKERPELAERLRKAIQQGDLSENADYQIAKEQQGFLEGRIQEIEFLLKNATIIDATDGKKDRVQIGSRVTVQEEGFSPETYQLVGVKEADPSKGRISHASPFGKSLLDKKVGDKVEINTPAGTISVRILKIE